MNYLATLITIWSISSIAALSLNIIVGYAGQLFVAQGVLMGVGAYTYARLTTGPGWSPWLCILLAIAFAAVTGLLFAVGSLRLRNYDYVLFTLIGQLVLTQVALGWTQVTGGATGITNIPRPSLGGTPLDDPRKFGAVCLVAVGVSGVLLWLAVRRLGLRLRSFRASERSAAALGQNVEWTRLTVGAIAGAGAGLAGALNASFVNFVQPSDYSIAMSILLVIYVMVGGAGSLLGTTVGVALIMAIPEIINHFNQVEITLRGPLAQMIYGAVIIAVVLFRPNGLVPERPLLRAGRFRGPEGADSLVVASAGGTS